VQLRLQFRQRQIGLRCNPGSCLLLRLNSGVGFASRLVAHTLGLPAVLALRRNLLCPT
jgi:hypothetical protein